jgi:glyoxalase family protein
VTTPTPTPEIHEATCIAGDPRRNLDFRVETLGMRPVKRSINHDDPGTYHFFYADAEGTPGPRMTCFPATSGSRGKVGSGPVARTAFRVPAGSLDYWEDRLDGEGVASDDRLDRFGETVLPFRDPDGPRSNSSRSRFPTTPGPLDRVRPGRGRCPRVPLGDALARRRATDR